MKTIFAAILALALCIGSGIAVETPPATPASSTSSSTKPKDTRLPGVALAEGISQITGTAISPLLGVSAVGAWQYYHTPKAERKALPWFCHPGFWGAGFVILSICLLKDLLGTVTPALLKKPFDMVELFENKASGLVASAAFVPFITAQIAENFGKTQAHLSTSSHLQLASILPIASVDLDARLLAMPLGIVAFLVVWLMGHAINVLISISPFSLIDTMLKTSKMLLLSAVLLFYTIHPFLGAALCLLLILIAAILAPTAFRLAVFGTMFATDTLLPWRARRHVAPSEAHAFAAHPISRATTRTYGRLIRAADGCVSFRYRPWLILPKRIIQLPPGKLSISTGVFFPSVLHTPEGSEKSTRILYLLPRYRSHERSIAKHLEISDIRDSSLSKGFKAAKAWIAELFDFGKSSSGPIKNADLP